MLIGEKQMLRYKREIIPPRRADYIEAPESIQTHYLPDVAKPAFRKKSPVIRTSDL